MSSHLKNVWTQPNYLTPQVAKEIASDIMHGKLTPSQLGAFLITLKLLGKETQPEYIAAVAEAMREAALPVSLNHELVDIVGTGGDGQDTFNVSTAASIVAAGAGCKVAKHGNRASSSSCGSADVLEGMNCQLSTLTPQKLHTLFEKSNFGFLFAQLYHPAMKSVAGPRKELGVRTIFNILGPLTNPAKPTRMIVGVFSKDLGVLMAKSLQLLGVERGWVVCGAIGLDEISPEGKTFVWEFEKEKEIVQRTISPADFGLPEHPLTSVKGGTCEQNAQIMNQLLDGTLSGPVLDFVLLNSAALLYVAGKASSLQEGVQLARKSISSGSARKEFNAFREATQ